jgi:uncharacterized oxidoreductase
MGGSQAYKGFGLALVLDMLAGGLTGGCSAHRGAPPAKGNNIVFILLDPDRFVGGDAQRHSASSLVDYVRTSAPAPGFDAITLPGDPERRTFNQRSSSGIPLEEAHWARLIELASKLGATVPVVS